MTNIRKDVEQRINIIFNDSKLASIHALVIYIETLMEESYKKGYIDRGIEELNGVHNEQRD